MTQRVPPPVRAAEPLLEPNLAAMWIVVATRWDAHTCALLELQAIQVNTVADIVAGE